MYPYFPVAPDDDGLPKHKRSLLNALLIVNYVAVSCNILTVTSLIQMNPLLLHFVDKTITVGKGKIVHIYCISSFHRLNSFYTFC